MSEFKSNRTPAQKKEFLDKLLSLWIESGDQRLGQMIANAAPGDIFFIDDYDLIGYIEDFVQPQKDTE